MKTAVYSQTCGTIRISQIPAVKKSSLDQFECKECGYGCLLESITDEAMPTRCPFADNKTKWVK